VLFQQFHVSDFKREKKYEKKIKTYAGNMSKEFAHREQVQREGEAPRRKIFQRDDVYTHPYWLTV
jgi:hypothetical protein